MTKLTQTAPERMYLRGDPFVEPPTYDIAEGLQPCRKSAIDIAYVRADLLEADNARIAELERLNLSFATNEQELAQYRNEKNWTRPFAIDGKLMAEHALYLPKVMESSQEHVRRISVKSEWYERGLRHGREEVRAALRELLGV